MILDVGACVHRGVYFIPCSDCEIARKVEAAIIEAGKEMGPELDQLIQKIDGITGHSSHPDRHSQHNHVSVHIDRVLGLYDQGAVSRETMMRELKY